MFLNVDHVFIACAKQVKTSVEVRKSGHVKMTKP